MNERVGTGEPSETFTGIMKEKCRKQEKTVEIFGKEEKLNAEVCDRAAVKIKESSNGGVGKKTADSRKRDIVSSK